MMMHYADSDRGGAKAIGKVQKGDAKNSLRSEKGIGTARIGIQAAAQG